MNANGHERGKSFNCLVSCSFSWQIYILNLPILTGLGKSRVFFRQQKNPLRVLLVFLLLKVFQFKSSLNLLKFNLIIGLFKQ